MTLDTSAISVLKSVTAHACAVMGEKRLAADVVKQTLRAHPRDKVLGCPDALDEMLRDIGVRAEGAMGRAVQTVHGGHFSALPLDARTCVSLRTNFALSFERIGRIMEIPSDEAKAAYETAIGVLHPEPSQSLRTSPCRP